MTVRDPELAALYAELQRITAMVEAAKRMIREMDETKQQLENTP